MNFEESITQLTNHQHITKQKHFISANQKFLKSILKMARLSAVLILIAAVAAASSQYLGFPYATTATSFALPYLGGFPYAPAFAPVGPVVKAAFPYGAHPYGPAYAHPGAPVVKTAFPYAAPFYKAAAFPFGATIVKTAVPAVAAPVLKAALPFPASIAGPAFGPVGPVGPPAIPAPIPAPVL